MGAGRSLTAHHTAGLNVVGVGGGGGGGKRGNEYICSSDT